MSQPGDEAQKQKQAFHAPAESTSEEWGTDPGLGFW